MPVVHFTSSCVMPDMVEFRFKLQAGGCRWSDRKSNNFSIA